MAACYCVLAGTAACQHCSQNPFATDVWTNSTITVDHVDVKLRPQTNADRIRQMTDEELAETYAGGCPNGDRLNCGKYYLYGGRDCFNCWLDWLKSHIDKEEE